MFYVNGEPHIGHLYSALLADANHRWTLLKENKKSDNLHQFIVGTDEHGIKVQTAAKNSGKTPKEHCDFYAERFRLLFEEFNIGYTRNLRTTDPEHEVTVKEMWNRLKSNGYIYKSTYEGWYSMVDERFYTEEEIEKRNINGEEVTVAKESLSKVEWIQEDNYMFKLEKFKDAIHKWLTTQGTISPASQLPHILQSLKTQKDLSISRDSTRLKWGIRVPDDDSQTLYVWLDALCSYLTATGFPTDTKWMNLWPADIHFIGKDIRTFHAIFWPAFLLAADLPLPKKIYVHSHWLVDGRKMSKSIGNVVNPFLIKDLLTVDGLRYFLLKQSTQHNDASKFIIFWGLFYSG
ncbi:unnamed protein product [Bursaphelenchus xylophilus]|uniref:Methionine--tRNA ligase, mitochondrial n=1 Tax=Bursaphelenchus xylophilus TaxID=6326 RepID=A0A1I7RK70_BURXY|nr:unnamed protein product [Bursaphelenchus xylophilus]CAG9131461.1 unnamed protein product [Bursaphelenchus xylophilus]